MRIRRLIKAFTLIEMIIVVLVIGVLIAVAVPNWIRVRETGRRNTCVSNLVRIRNAVAQWAMDNKKTDPDTVALTDVIGTDLYIKSMPSCSSGGTYALSTVGVPPTCSKNGAPDLHVLP